MAIIKKIYKLNTGEVIEKREPSYTVGWNVNWLNHYNPEIPLLGIYMEKTIIQKDTCTPMFIAALSIIAKTW